MNLGHDIERKIILHASGNQALHLVCKAWNKVEMDRKRRSVATISKWYKSFPFNLDNIDTHGNMRSKLRIYEDNWVLDHPEFAIQKLRLPETLLASLPPRATRTKSDVSRWVRNNRDNISYENWLYVGF